jgi:hypothetical protein
MTEKNTPPETNSAVAAELRLLEGLKVVDFALPVTALSLVLAVCLLLRPSSFLEGFGQSMADGHAFWIVAGVASIANAATYFLSVPTRLSVRHILTAGLLVCAVWIVLAVSFGLLYVPVKSSPSGPPPAHAVIEQLARFYLVLVTATFFPCPVTVGIVELSRSLFDDDTKNRNHPTSLPS